MTVICLPAPPVDADDSYAVDQTVTAESSGSMRRTLTLVALIGDVRVTASWQQEGSSETTPDVAPDTQALDTLFTDAVLKVRRIGGRLVRPQSRVHPQAPAAAPAAAVSGRCRLRRLMA